MAAIKSSKHPEVRNRYQAIKKRRGHKKAIVAIARMLLTAIYNILKKNEPYNAELYRQSDKPPVQREVAVEQAILSFDANGELIATIPVGPSFSFTRYQSGRRVFRYAEQIFMPIWENKQYLIVPNLAMACDIDNPQPGYCLFANQYDNGMNTLLIADTSSRYAGTAFYYEQGQLIATMALPICNPGVFDPYPWQGADAISKIEWSENHRVQITNQYFGTTVSLDLQNNTADAIYHLNPDYIVKYDENYPPPQSLNKRYRIVKSSSWSPDDAPIAYYNGWLHDTASDEYSFIDIFTSAFGGSGDICGFIDDSRFYRIKFPGPVTIYNIINSELQPAFVLSGEAVAVTYSSGQWQYYVLELGEKSADLVIWNENGELISRHSTNIPITNHFEGIYSPDISVSGNTLYYESPDLNGWVKGTLDLTTFEFVQTAKE